jgi:predicted DNA-binding protein
MVVHLKPETESRLRELSAATGRQPEEFVEDAMAAYLSELNDVRQMLETRYDDVKFGRVNPIDGDEAFKTLRTKSESRRRS